MLLNCYSEIIKIYFEIINKSMRKYQDIFITDKFIIYTDNILISASAYKHQVLIVIFEVAIVITMSVDFLAFTVTPDYSIPC